MALRQRASGSGDLGNPRLIVPKAHPNLPIPIGARVMGRGGHRAGVKGTVMAKIHGYYVQVQWDDGMTTSTNVGYDLVMSNV